MLAGIIGFEIRYQLKNPVFWVSAAIFFLLGFGLTASENVHGVPHAVSRGRDGMAVSPHMSARSNSSMGKTGKVASPLPQHVVHSAM